MRRPSRGARNEHLVLVTNDDGIDSLGVIALAHALQRAGLKVIVAAPDLNMSGAGAAIGPVEPSVPIRRVEVPGIDAPCFAIAAPPAMIVIAGKSGAFGPVPTAVASGVNNGVNLGRAVLHSGTVGAALTAQNLGLPAVAVSVQHGGDWVISADIGVGVLLDLLDDGHPRVANVNVPKTATADVRLESTVLAQFGSVTAALSGDALDFELVIDPARFEGPGTDGRALRDGCASVTYLQGIVDTRHAEPSFGSPAAPEDEVDADVDVSLRRVEA